MTTKLTANRYNLRDLSAGAAPAAAPAAAAAAPASAPAPAAGPVSVSSAVRAMAQQAAATTGPNVRPAMAAARPQPAPAPRSSDDNFFAEPDDGFGQNTFETARNPTNSVQAELDAIRRENLTGRDLRLARRAAQKHGLPATSDFDAVRLLRAKGIDPFQKTSIMELLMGDESDPADPQPAAQGAAAGTGMALAASQVQLPQTIQPVKVPSTQVRGSEDNALGELIRIQRDIAKRRRRKSFLLAARLGFFVLLPALLVGWYYYMVATPFYSTNSQFVIQKADGGPASSGAGAGFLAGLSGTPMANSQDSILVQSYLQSPDAMLRLDEQFGFRKALSDPSIDPIQRLPEDASIETAYKLYHRLVKIGYDPTDGVIRMDVIAPSPDLAVKFSDALIGFAEEQVDKNTLRLREDQMTGAQERFDNAQTALQEAQQRLVTLQEKFKILSSEAEVGMITSQIGQLEAQVSQDRLAIAQIESNANPNRARLDPLKQRVVTLEAEIQTLRARLTEGGIDGESLAEVQSELLVAQADLETRQMMLTESLQAMQVAQIEANRQVRYLSVMVPPVMPETAAYPRAFENTIVALLIFGGIYLMISMTAAILREQMSS